MVNQQLKVTSPVFENNGLIPKKYTGHGENLSPPLCIKDIPAEAKSLALTMFDKDIPFGIIWTHWVMWNIPPSCNIAENSAPGKVGKNSSRKNAYLGPKPPFGAHRYLFKIYALDISLQLDSDATRKDVEKAIETHVLAEGELCGLYHKHKQGKHGGEKA